MGNHKIIEMGEKGIGGSLMVLNHDYTGTRGKSSHYFKDADLIQPLIKLRIKSIRLMAFNQSSLNAFIGVQRHNK